MAFYGKRLIVTYATLMVHLELGEPNTGLLQVARSLADRFGAHVIGIVASQPIQLVFGGSYAYGDVVQLDREEVETEINVAEAEFRTAFQGHSKSAEWRSTVTLGTLCDYVSGEARSADLIVTGLGPKSLLDESRCLDLGEFVLRAGRPVFIVPRSVTQVKLDKVVIAWKDTRETRRAALDALPILKLAAHVAVVEIASDGDLADARVHVRDIVEWLKRHGVTAQAVTSGSTGDDASCLSFIVQEQKADIVVAGAYGHSRLREWVLGGVTRDLLLNAKHCSLISH
jgi:nucleotide-binding universal stress UspA family protein